MKLRIWCDSGANTHSKRVVTITPGDLGLTQQQWDDLSEEERERLMRDIAFEQLDWGYEEVPDTQA
jgi:hypothetical protein